MKKDIVVKNGNIVVEYDQDKLDALSMQLEENHKNLDTEILDHIEQLYCKNVNPKLRQFIEYRKRLSQIAGEQNN